MKKYEISTANPYNIYVAEGILSNSGKLINEILEPCKIAIITDTNVNGLYSQVFITSLIEHGFEVSKIIFPSGEHSKNINTYSNLLEALADEGISRSDAIAALGGGVVGDISGFAAATYMRGIKYIHIPTSFVASIDSSIGGKTGINLLSGKNLAGAFWQPSLVICDPKVLETLPEPQLFEGVAEAIKIGITSDSGLINKVLEHEYTYVIERAISIKKSIVEADERDVGLRQILNFGHTIGHCIEKASSYNISHGNAVAKGMAAEAKASALMGFTSQETADEIAEILEKAGFDLSIDYKLDDLYHYALLDKKISMGKITIVVPNKVGQCHLAKISVPELRAFFEKAVG
ncbi:3-dehydroquinate synthase [Eubacteriales bacterium KG125]